MEMDIRTLFLMFAIGYLLTTLCLLVYVLVHKPKKPILNIFIVSRFLVTVSSILFVLRSPTSHISYIVFSNLVIIYTTCFEAYCILNANKSYNGKKFLKFNLIPALLSIVFILFSIGDENARVIVLSVMFTLGFMTCGISLLVDKQKTKIQKVAAGIYFILSALFLFRVIIAIQLNLGVYSGYGIQPILYTLFYFISFSWVVIMLLILKEQDAIKIQNDNIRLVDLNNKKDKLFSIIAHDLKNPIGGLSMLGQALTTHYDNMTEEPKEKLIKVISESSKKTYSLLDNLLQWSRSETGLLELNKTRLKLKEIMESNLSLMREGINSKNMEVKIDLNDTDSAFADYNMINTVIRNLLTNAIKFTPKNGTIHIYTTKNNDGTDIQLSIEDNGVGIPKDVCATLFDIDSRYTSRGTEDESGTGLGLKLCKEFIDKNDGRISIKSEVNLGSTFTIELPI